MKNTTVKLKKLTAVMAENRMAKSQEVRVREVREVSQEGRNRKAGKSRKSMEK
jgi:hypothetical protein